MTAPPQLFGRYHLGEILGEGGFATVYRAWDPLLGRELALKALFPHLSRNPEVRSRFITEARAVASLRHGNIVAFYDVDDVDGQPFYTMELIEGPTLSRLLEPGVPLDTDRALGILRGLASALDYLHAAGLVHRDVKPSNVMLDPAGRAVLMDFGIARVLDETQYTRTGAILGTPEYMAPEQALGEPAGPAADIYALAVLAFQLLSGSLPFGGNAPTVLRQQAFDPPPLLSDVRPDLPPQVSRVLDAALAKRPESRTPLAVGMVESLASALQERHLLPGAPTPLEEAPPFVPQDTAEREYLPQLPPEPEPFTTPLPSPTPAPAPPSVYVEPPPPPLPVPTPQPVYTEPAYAEPVYTEPTYAEPEPPLPPPTPQPAYVAPPKAPPVSPPGRRSRRALVLGGLVAAVALAAAGSGIVAVMAHGGRTTAPHTATVTPAQVAVTTRAPSAPAQSATRTPLATTASATPVPTPTPTPSPTPRPATAVTDAELLPSGAATDLRLNLTGANGAPLGVLLLSHAAAGGCTQPYLQLLRPDAADHWHAAWDAAQAPDGAPLLPTVSDDGGCAPAVSLFGARNLEDGRPALVLGMRQGDGSQRLAVVAVDATGSPAIVAEAHTTPGDAQVNLPDGTAAAIGVVENAYPPASSGLNPSYDTPTGRLSLLLTLSGAAFEVSTPTLAPNCPEGTLTQKSATDGGLALQLACPDGSASAFLLSSGATTQGGFALSDLNVGDDVTLAGLDDASLAPSDPLSALPAASSINAPAALARYQARIRPAPAPVNNIPAPAPTRAPVAAPAAAAAPAAQPVSQPAPQPVAQPAPQPVAQPAPPRSPPAATVPPQPAPARAPVIATVPPQPTRAPAAATVPPQPR